MTTWEVEGTVTFDEPQRQGVTEFCFSAVTPWSGLIVSWRQDSAQGAGAKAHNFSNAGRLPNVTAGVSLGAAHLTALAITCNTSL